jgi:integrase/DNA-binding XRE family transcriptional regulator
MNINQRPLPWRNPTVAYVVVPQQSQQPIPPTPEATNPVSLRQYFEAVYRPCQLVGCSKKTLDAYQTTLNLWEHWEGNMPIDRITSRTLAQFADSILPNRSAASVNSYLRPIVAMLRYASEEDDIGKMPRFRRLKEPKRVPLGFTTDEFASILRVAKQVPGMISGIRASLWWPCFLCVAFESGLRIRAILSVAVHDILMEQNGFYCQAENQKDAEADWYPLSENTMNLVRSIYDTRRELLFPLDKTVCWLRNCFRRIMELAEVYAPKGASMAFHRIRKSTASHIAAAGGDAQRKLGHSSPLITAHYLDPRVTRASKPHEMIPAPSPSHNVDNSDSSICWRRSSGVRKQSCSNGARKHPDNLANESLETRLRELIAASSEGIYAIAKTLGISNSILYTFAAGKRHLKIETAEKLCQYFSIEMTTEHATTEEERGVA